MKKIATIVVYSICIVLLPGAEGSAQVPDEDAGTIFSVQGTVTMERNGKVLPVVRGDEIRGGDIVITGEPGRVAIELRDGSYIRVASGSRMTVPVEKKAINLVTGALHFFSHSEKHPVIETQQVTAAIRGTEFTVHATADQSTISMFSGALTGESTQGTLHLQGGEGARFSRRKPPERFAILASERSVQWSAFLPLLEEGEVTARGREALALYRDGKVSEALALLDRQSGASGCTADGVLRARLTVAAGDPVTGARLLERCVQSKEPLSEAGSQKILQQGAELRALQAVAQASLAQIYLERGELGTADLLLSEAQKVDPYSRNVALIRSFLLQSRGDLDGALEALASAATPEMEARRAELLFMRGDVPRARKMLEALSPRSWYAETVYGFVLLADRAAGDAEQAFRRAAESEPGAGLPHMGLGLVKVGRNELAAAREEFEQAIVLEPSRSIYRSYLGKAYFEDDTYAPAHPEYARAIELDPNDPTPHLYRSFMRVAENDLVGALEDITEARRLVGARDVYRSSFLLDQDSAMQSASIGRVYQQLGFKERGRIEGITALTDDYQNASAHRLVSQTQEDIFAADTIASEQRISNLFSPLSVNVVDSIGTNVSLNEYSQLFERDGWRTATNTAYDSKDDFFRSGVLSAYKDENTVLGLSADGAARDGVTDDPRTSAGTFGLSLQRQPSWADRFLLEAKGIFTGSSDRDGSTDDMFGNASAAYLHRFSPAVTAIIQSTYDRNRQALHRPFLNDVFLSTVRADGESDTQLLDVTLDQRAKRYETNVVTEGQLIAHHGAVTSILTARNATTDVDSYDKSIILEDSAGELTGRGATLRSSGPVNLSGNSVSYLGDYRVIKPVNLQFGGEFESIEWASEDEPAFTANTTSRTLWSPKGGLVFRPDERVAARIGYGESLGKGTNTQLVSIEPTMIGGITQRYNDLVGTKAQNLGIGLDLHPVEDTFFGAEWTRRWLDENRSSTVYEYIVDLDAQRGYGTVNPGESYDVPIGQDFLSAYLYKVMTRQLVTGVDYRFSRQAIKDEEHSHDHRGVAFARYFFADGFFLQGSTAYRYQNQRSFSDQGNLTRSDGAWLMGAGIGYRLPTRHGLLLLDIQNIFGEDISIDQSSYFNEPVFSDPTVRLVANVNF
jgi:tetratricopeptide (TPR) repeat protein